MCKVNPLSRSEIRGIAWQLRQKLGCIDRLHFPIVKFLELYPEIDKNFHFEIVEDLELATNTHACINLATCKMKIKNHVYEGAYKGVGRDRMTIAHEFGHYFLHRNQINILNRNRTNGLPIKPYEDSEWQASCFGGELLVPAKLIREPFSIEDLAYECGVSIEAMEMQLKHIRNSPNQNNK